MTEAAQQLLIEANQSAYINHIREAHMKRLIDRDAIRFLAEDDQLLGFAGWIHINRSWIELGPFFVSQHHQGRGLGKQLVAETVALTHADYNLYAITFNPAMAALLEKSGMRSVPVFELPFAVLLHLVGKLRPGHLSQVLTQRGRISMSHYILPHANESPSVS
jgi:RimJ/RimL family protein N-acetyltransferase